MPNHFEHTQDGRLLIASGFDHVLSWDGHSSTAEVAGVPAPATAPVIAGAGFGKIVGRYRAYMRFLDKNGRVSNLSPVSEEVVISGTSGFVYGATSESPIRITTPGHGLTTGTVVFVEGVEGNTAANGYWTIQVRDPNSFWLLGSASNGAYSGPSSASAGVTSGAWYTGVHAITYNNLPVPNDQKIVRRQVLRNTNGQFDTYYVDVDAFDITGTYWVSNRSDDQLANQQAVPLFRANESDNAISVYGLPPNDRKFMASMLGRTLAAGEVIYNQGAISVTYGSNTAYGIGTEWNPSCLFRTITIDGDPEPKTIGTIFSDTQQIGFSPPYRGVTNPYASYSIRPAGSSRALDVDFSQVGQPEAWSPTDRLTLEKDRIDNEVTGMVRSSSFIYVLFRRGAKRLTYQRDPNPSGGDGAVYPAFNRGCINNRCWSVVENIPYMLDEFGVHAFSGPDNASVSRDMISLFRPTADSEYVINWKNSEFFHSVHDPSSEKIRWFVCLDGSKYPKHCLVFDYQRSVWWIEEYFRPIASSCIGKMDGKLQVFLGSNAGQVLAAGAGSIDGPDVEAGTTRGNVTSSGATWIQDSSALFASEGLVNNPIHIVDGSGRGQWRRVVQVDGTKIYVDQPWLARLDATSVYQLGGISWKWRSKTFKIASSQTVEKRIVATTTRPTETKELMNIKVFYDRKESPVNWGRSVASGPGEGVRTIQGEPEAVCDLSKARGFHQIAFDDQAPRGVERERHIEVELSGVKGQSQVEVYELAIAGVEGDQ